MPRLYLFRITQTQSRLGRRVAILTKLEKDPELSEIKQGELTGYFDSQKLARDGVDYKGSIEVGDDIYNKVIEKMEKAGKNPSTRITTEGGRINLFINNEPVMLNVFATASRNFIEYPYVFIK